ncbi:MAG: hypothetical protein AB7S51_02365 [Porticoccaceae bacterium]|jgi:hypothetical protein
MAERTNSNVVSLPGDRVPYAVYRSATPLSAGTELMLQRMGMRWYAPLACWTNAPESWRREQIAVLLGRALGAAAARH